MDYTYERVKEAAERTDGVVRLDLGIHDTAWNPASTKHVVVGPKVVEYLFHADGGVDCTVIWCP